MTPGPPPLLVCGEAAHELDEPVDVAERRHEPERDAHCAAVLSTPACPATRAPRRVRGSPSTSANASSAAPGFRSSRCGADRQLGREPFDLAHLDRTAVRPQEREWQGSAAAGLELSAARGSARDRATVRVADRRELVEQPAGETGDARVYGLEADPGEPVKPCSTAGKRGVVDRPVLRRRFALGQHVPPPEVGHRRDRATRDPRPPQGQQARAAGARRRLTPVGYPGS